MQLKGYAQSQSANPAVGSSYMGMAVEGRKARINYFVGNGEAIIAAAYILPFVVVFLVLLLIPIGICCCCCSTLDKAEKAIKASHQLLANTVAVTLVCLIFTIYTFVLDIIAWVRESQTDELPSYYMKINDFVIITRVPMFIYLIFITVGLVVECCICCKEKNCYLGSSLYSIVGSAILSFTAHFPSILMAWATDPFYASRIAIFYGFTIGAYFTAFHFTYILLSRALCDVDGSKSEPLCEVEDGKLVPCSSLFCKVSDTGKSIKFCGRKWCDLNAQNQPELHCCKCCCIVHNDRELRNPVLVYSFFCHFVPHLCLFPQLLLCWHCLW